MPQTLQILNLEDSMHDTELIRETLLQEDISCEVRRVDTKEEFGLALEGRVDLVLVDYSLPGFDGMSALEYVRQKFPDLPFIFVSGTMGEEIAIEALKNGATDYVLKHQLSRLGPAVRRAMQEAEANARRRAAEAERETTIGFLRLVHESKGTRDLIRAATAFFQQQSGCEAVGIRLKKGEDYPYFEARGFPKEFVLLESSLCARDSAGDLMRDSSGQPILECMCGNIISGRFDPTKSFFTKYGSFWSNNTTELLGLTTDADRQTKTRNRCNGEGYESVALLPLRLGEERLGLLQLNDRRTNVFSEEVMGLWERLADQLAVALAKFKSDEALRESEERFRMLFENSIDAVMLATADGKILSANSAACRMFGRQEAELLAMGRDGIVDPNDPRLKVLLVERERTGRVSGETTFLRKDGSSFQGEVSSVIFKDKEGNQRGSVFIRDITERKSAEQERKESKERFSTVFHASPVGIIISRFEDGKIFDVNNALTRKSGYSREELIGKTALELNLWVHPEEQSVVVDMLREQGRARNIEAKFRTKSGVIVDELVSAELIQLNGEDCLLSMFTDITNRKKMEEDLRASAQQWNNTFDAMNDPISVMDAQGTILRSNMAMNQLVGQDSVSTSGHPCWIVHNEKQRVKDCPFQKMLQSRRRQSSLIHQAGRWFNITADPIFDSAGNVTGGVHIMTDITESRRFEDALAESEQKYRQLVDTALVGVYRSTEDGKFLFVNEALARIFECDSVEEMLSTPVLARYSGAGDRDTFLDLLRKKMRVPYHEIEVPTKKDNMRTIVISAVLEEGVITGMVLDITEQKRLEAQVRQAQKIEAIGTLAGGIAHDFNNVLSAIIGYGHLALTNMAEDNPYRFNIQHILDASQRATDLTKSLLAFSRKQSVNLVSTDLNALIRQFENLLRRLLREDIDFKTISADSGLTIMADSGQVEQVLMNLVTNARDAMPNGGRLTVETRRVTIGKDFLETHGYGMPGDYALLIVSDTGTGMNEAVRRKVFDPFFTTKEVGKGSGLGLAVVYGIVKKHEGFINLYSEEGYGSSFKIYFPLAKEDSLAGPEKQKKSNPTDAGPRGTETILLVEDDASLRKLSTSILKHFGYAVIEAVDGEDALVQFDRHKDRIQLVILDAIMPKKNGWEAYQELRKIRPTLKFIFMSGYSEDIFSPKNIEQQGLAYLLKPVIPVDLLKKVREVLDA